MSFLHPTAVLFTWRKAGCCRFAAPGNPFDPDDPHRTDRLDDVDFLPAHDKT